MGMSDFLASASLGDAKFATLTMRQWFTVLRARGELSLHAPSLLSQLAEALDTTAGRRLRNVCMDADRILVENVDGVWKCRLSEASPSDQADDTPIQPRFADTLRQCLEPELAANASDFGVRRLQAVLRRGEHEKAMARYSACQEFAQTVGAELTSWDSKRSRPLRTAETLSAQSDQRVGRAQGLTTDNRRMTRALAVVSGLIGLLMLVVVGLSLWAASAYRSHDRSAEQLSWDETAAWPESSEAHQEVQNDPGRDRSVVESADVSQATSPFSDQEPAIENAKEQGALDEMPGAQSLPLADSGGRAAFGGESQPEGDAGPAVGSAADIGDRRRRMPISVNTSSGRAIDPASLLGPCANDPVQGRRLLRASNEMGITGSSWSRQCSPMP